MAKRTATKATDWNDDAVIIPESARKASSELAPTRKIKENTRIVGVFQSFKMTTITDTNTKKPKEVPVYTFRDANDSTKKFAVLGGRVGMDSAFEDLADESGGWEGLKGMMVCIERGEDSDRANGAAGSIGNYNLYSWLPEKD
jgi:hypothetical protein